MDKGRIGSDSRKDNRPLNLERKSRGECQPCGEVGVWNLADRLKEGLREERRPGMKRQGEGKRDVGPRPTRSLIRFRPLSGPVALSVKRMCSEHLLQMVGMELAGREGAGSEPLCPLPQPGKHGFVSLSCYACNSV